MTNMSKDHNVEKEKIPSLNRLYFYLTEGCNLACRHCWLSPKLDPSGDRYPTLPVELFETAIREAKPLGLNSVKLTGGEPLLHPQLLCTPEIAAKIAQSPNRSVSVSIDGADAATHEWVRGVRGSFELARQAVSNLVTAGISPQIIFSVMPCNIEQVDAIVNMAEDLGASSVKFNIIQPIARGERYHGYDDVPSIEDLINLGRYVEMKLAKNRRIKLFFDYPMAFRALSRIASGDGCGVCGIIGILGVISSGHYALCGIGEHISELVFGKVGVVRLEKVWLENPTLNELRSGLPDRLDGVCSRCLMKHGCIGSCIAENYYRTGSFWGPYWFCERAEERGLFPESRIGTAKDRA
jgi:SynChlorMet cassette radical SAM/SPASM protein ScmF